MLLHPNIHRLDISRAPADCGKVSDDQPPVGYNTLPVTFIMGLVRRWQWANVTLCRAFNSGLLCEAYVRDTPCHLLPDWDIFEEDESCIMGLKVPVPRQLRYLAVRSMPIAFSDVKGKNRNKLCFSTTNVLEEFDMSCARTNIEPFTSIYFKGLTRVKFLRMRYSGLKDIFRNSKLLDDFPALTRLDTSGTFIGGYIASDKDSVIFKNTHNLTLLDLSHTGLTYIPFTEFDTLKGLHTLNMTGNNLSSLYFHIAHMTSLQDFDLSSSNISIISAPMRKELKSLSQSHQLNMNLSNNALSCTCNSIDFVKWLHTTRLRLVKNETYTCQHPKYGLMAIMNVNVEELEKMCTTPPIWRDYLIAVSDTIKKHYRGTCAYLFWFLARISRHKNR